MTDTLAAPAQTRPPHIPRDWWYRATWHARQTAIDAHNRANRPEDRTIDRDEPATPTTYTTQERLDTAAELLADNVDPYAIAARLSTTVSALEQLFRRRGMKDHARPFLKARKVDKVHPCADCGKDVSERAKRCGKCAAQEAGSRPELRAKRSELARTRGKFGVRRAA